MSRYAHEHPEQFEPGGSGFDPLLDKYDRDGVDRNPYSGMRPCAACGEPCSGHWCSESCRRAEDGPSADEADEMERAEEERDE